MLRMYFDASGKDDNPDSQFVTLAGFAAADELWLYFDRQWNQILRDRGAAPYVHMKEAIQHRGAFDGWTAKETEFLIQGLIGLLMQVNGSRKFCGFQCTVDLSAHRRYALVNDIPPVNEMCSSKILVKTLQWYSVFPDVILSSIDIFFDQGDNFLNALRRRWQNKSLRLKQPWWNLIRTIEPKDMRNVPGLQAADMLSWSRNRLKTRGSDGWAGHLATDIQGGVELYTSDYTESFLRCRKFQNKYGFYT